MTVELDVCEIYGIRHSEFLAWDADDRDKAILHYLRKRAECPHCHTRPEEWDESRGGDRWAYVADEILCRGCEITDAYKAAMPKDDQTRGVYVVLRPRREVDGGGDTGP